MRNFLISCLITVWLTAACALLPHPTSYASPLRSLVVVTTTIEGQPSLCTGFTIDLIDVVTAKHCVSEDSEVLINGQHGARVLRTSSMLALLQVDEPFDVPGLTIRPDDPKIGGDELFLTYGYGFGHLSVLERGIIDEVYVPMMRPEGNLLVMDGPLIPGMSGGPVVDGKNRVVGVNQATNDNRSLISGTAELRDFIAGR